MVQSEKPVARSRVSFETRRLRRRSSGRGVARGSYEPIPDQELQRPVEPDLRRGFAALGQGRAEAHEPPVVVGFGERNRVALKDRVRIGRQFAWKDSRLGDSVERLPANRLAFFRYADDRVERLTAGLDLSLAGGADRSQRDHIDLRP